jgi:single-strand DNA-binding protein
MNALTMTGNLVDDPQLEHAGETPVANMRLAVDNGRHATTYIDVSCYGEQAYSCVEYLRKGRKVGVNGRLALDEWRNRSGEARKRYRAIGRVEFLDRPAQPGEGGVRQPELEPSDGDGEARQPELALAA